MGQKRYDRHYIISWVLMGVLTTIAILAIIATPAKAEMPKYLENEDPKYFVEAWKRKNAECYKIQQKTDVPMVFNFDTWECEKFNPEEPRDDWKEFT